MRVNKKIGLGMFFIIGILLMTFFISADYMRSNPKYTSSLGSEKSFWVFDKTMCEAGQDFIIQIAPFGCTPAVVRSDLLEEQNVPVFCQLAATKINPLIDVEAIESISFRGDYPKEVSGIGFHPARAALGVKGNLNSPILNNIGYVVIVLKKQKNESAMPNFVEGTLTARISYDIKNAFGIGSANFYLPELSDPEWEDKYTQYSFWNGRFFLRAENIDDNGARISVYDETKKISGVNLKKGETSKEIYLPGFDCLAGLELRLNGLENPDTRAKLRVDADVVEVAEKEKFLENKCSIPLGGIEKQGVVQTVIVRCNEDEAGFFGGKPFTLIISPKIKLDFEGANEEGYEVGDYLYETQDRDKKFVYLGYVGTRRDTEKEKDLYAYLVAIPEQKEKLSRTEISAMVLQDKLLRPSTDTGAGTFWDTITDAYKIFFGSLMSIGKWIIKGEHIGFLRYSQEEKFLGKNIKLVGFADPQDEELDDDTKTSYDLATKDYGVIHDSFAGEKHPEDERVGFGELALVEEIKLARDTGQKRTMLKLCEDFKASYPKSQYKSQIMGCDDEYKLSNSEISEKYVLINGKVKKISFDGIYEPGFEEYGAEILVKGPNGEVRPLTLGKNQIKYLDDFRGSEENIFYVWDIIERVFFVYDSKWYWSMDTINWERVSKTKVEGGTSPVLEKNINLIKSLQDKDFEKGRRILLDNEAKKKGTTEFIQLISLDEDSAKINLNIMGVRERLKEIFITETKVLKKDITEGVGEYAFTLTNVNLKKTAKVSVIPKINNAGTEANFTFKIGIEKRAIQLSPEKTKKKIKELNKTIEELEETSESLGKVVKGFKAACLGVGALFTVKNFIENTGGKAIARQNVMRGEEGWYERCIDLVSDGTYISQEQCMVEEADNIERDVDTWNEVMEEQNNQIKADQRGITEKKFLSESVVDTDKFMQNYIPRVQTYLRENLGDTFEDPDNGGKSIDMNKMITSLSYDSWRNSSNYDKEQLRDIELYARILNDPDTSPELREIANKRLYSEFSDIQEVSGNYVERSSMARDFGIDPSRFAFLETDKDTKKIAYGGLTYADIKGKAGLSPLGIEEITPVQFLQISSGEMYILVLDDSSGTGKMPIRKMPLSREDGGGEARMVYDLQGNRISDSMIPSVIKNSYFEKYDRTSYQNKYKNAEVKYYETEPYKGLPAIVPFDLDNGWYAATKQTLPIFGNIQAYDESGRVTSFYLCNVGENGIQEFKSGIGDEICTMINLGTGQPYTQFPGLEKREASRLVTLAVKAVEDASRQYKPGVRNVRINRQNIPVGSPAADIPDMQCQDFMSPKDCQLLFNVCDPVVCPSSRCDFGGAYPVRDVVQSGIIGSIVLCLPNFREGIYVPVCLSGVKAGIDGLLSVYKSYRDCLQNSLDTGEMVGICDEIYSIYMCEFLWRQALPLAKMILPKMIEFAMGQNVRGGGEYLGVESAWDNADKSMTYFTQYYAANSYKAFKARTTEEVGAEICKLYVSGVYPEGGNLIDALIEPDSPSQFHGRFDEIPFTSTTVPPISHYKVFYHIYAGKDSGAYYKVYLKGGSESSFYQDISLTRFVASGYIPAGEYISETRDFTAPSGYKEMCINVNGQEECGFKQVSTSFAVDYVTDEYLAKQSKEREIKTETECIAGSASAYSLLSPNIQGAAEEIVNPAIYDRGIIRICATDNPGKGTDPYAEGEGSRWVEVGYCDNKKIKCWLDTKSVKNVIQGRDIEEDVLKTVTENQLEILRNREGYIGEEEFSDKITEIDEEKDSNKKIGIINEIFDKVFLNSEKAYLLFLRGNAYGELTIVSYMNYRKMMEAEKEGGDIFERCQARVDEGEFSNISECIDFIQGEAEEAVGPRELTEEERRLFRDVPEELLQRLTEEEKLSVLEICEEKIEDEESLIVEECVLEEVEEELEEEEEVEEIEEIRDCQKVIGERIIEIAKEQKILRSVDYEAVYGDTGAENFECLVLQVAIQESNLQHCKKYKEGSCFECKGVWFLERVEKNEESIGVMQINIKVHKNVDAKDFEENVKYGINLLIENYNPAPKSYGCAGKNYVGWERALRFYNGWNTDCSKGDVNYVENVINQKTKIRNMFPEECRITFSAEEKRINDIIDGKEELPSWEWVKDSGKLGKDPSCARYVREAAKELFDLDYHWADAWCRKITGDKVVWETSEMDVYRKSSTQQGQIREFNNDKLKELEENGELIPGMIVGAYYPKTSYDNQLGKKQYCATAEKDEIMYYTHNLLYLGKNNNDEMVFAELFRLGEPGLRTLNEFDNYGLIAMAVFSAPEELDKEVSEEQKEAQGGIDGGVIKENCEDGIDNDLDGYIDCADTDCNGILLAPQNVIFSTSKIKTPFFNRFKFSGGSSGGGGAERPLDLCQYKVTGISIPRPINFVSDYAKVIDDDIENRLNDILYSLKDDKGIEIAIVSMFSVDRGIKQIAKEVFDEWEIGENDKGILIIFSLKSEVVRIEVGYALDSIITDGGAGELIDENLIGNLDEENIESALIKTINSINKEIE